MAHLLEELVKGFLLLHCPFAHVLMHRVQIGDVDGLGFGQGLQLLNGYLQSAFGIVKGIVGRLGDRSIDIGKGLKATVAPIGAWPENLVHDKDIEST